jgi:hypothetical protein
MIAALLPLLAGVLDKVLPRVVTDKDQVNAIKAEVTTLLIAQEGELRKAAADIVKTEALGHSWLQRNWRPLLMLVIVAIIANNYLVAPYAQAMFGVGIALDLPERLWDLMTVGVGGYVVGRTAERGIELWRGGNGDGGSRP